MSVPTTSEPAEISGVSSLNGDERETVVTVSDASDVVHIWTAQRTAITRLRKHPKVTEIKTGYHGTSVWAEFTIPSDQWNPVTGIKRTVNLSDEKRQALADRFAAARARHAAGMEILDEDDE